MPTLYSWLAEKPFTLAMSSGFFSFYAHFGMVSALAESGLKPAKVCGSSAGALVAATLGSKYDSAYWHEKYISLKKEDFWSPGFGFGLLKSDKFKDELQKLLPCSLEQSELEISVSCFDLFAFQTRIYSSQSLSHGNFLDAIAASCAFPFLFQPVKVERSYCLDGGIKDRHGLASAENDSRILYHHIASRSPWRSKNSPALKLPSSTPEQEIKSLVIEGITRSGPNKMHLAESIIQQAKEATKNALKRKLGSDYMYV